MQKYDYNIFYVVCLQYFTLIDYSTNSGGTLLESSNHPTFI
jgi:hypothetical protein